MVYKVLARNAIIKNQIGAFFSQLLDWPNEASGKIIAINKKMPFDVYIAVQKTELQYL